MWALTNVLTQLKTEIVHNLIVIKEIKINENTIL